MWQWSTVISTILDVQSKALVDGVLHLHTKTQKDTILTSIAQKMTGILMAMEPVHMRVIPTLAVLEMLQL